MLSLMQALNEDRLEDFIAQEEGRGVGPISEAEFDLGPIYLTSR